MNQGREITRTKEQVTSAGAAGARQVAPGTVLLSFKLSIGKVARAAIPLYTNEAIAALPIRRPDLITENFLMRALEHADLMQGSNRAAMGATLNKAKLKAVRLPVPPLGEQQRITMTLDRADAIRAKRRRVLASVDSLAQSVFMEMFAGSSQRVRLGDLANTTSGGTPNRAVSANYGGGIPWVKSGELHAGVVTETEETISELGLSSSSAKLFPAGTVVLAMYGATAGVVGRLGIDAATNQAVCGITPGPQLDAEYLVAALRAQTRNLVAKAAGGAQPNLSQGIVRNFEIPVPDIADQERFAAKVAVIGSHRSVIVRALAYDDALFQSLQSRALRGEL